MAGRKVTLLDYGVCNMLNIARALGHVGADVVTTEEAVAAARAERLVVPGVGAFAHGMSEVIRRGHADAIRAFVASGRPILGICVGLQMLFEGSEEFGDNVGLAILPGFVRRVPERTVDGAPQRVPHIGWSHLVPPEGGRTWAGSVLPSEPGSNPAVYFVHSFAAVPTMPSDRLADCVYGGHRICAAVQRDNLTAVQFHPERSGEVGLAMLRRFVEG